MDLREDRRSGFLTDEELVGELKRTWARERRHTAWFLACLAEADSRGFLLERGFSSTFSFCVKELGMLETDAVRRIKVARKSKQFPELLSLLGDGSLSLSVAALIAPLLSPPGAAGLIDRCVGKSYRDVERIVATIAPSVAMPDRIRILAPTPPIQASPTGPVEAGLIEAEPSSALGMSTQCDAKAGLVHFSFTGTEELEDCLKRLRALLWHKHPQGRLGDVFLEIARDYLDRRDPARRIAANGAREKRRDSDPRSRRIPGWVKDRVRERDGVRCAYVAADGRRCEAATGLEFDHIRPWALGGVSNDPDNIRLLCAAHNRLEGRRFFGGPPGEQGALFKA